MKKLLLIGLIATSGLYPMQQSQAATPNKYAHLKKEFFRRVAFCGAFNGINRAGYVYNSTRALDNRRDNNAQSFVEGSLEGAFPHALLP